MTCGLSYSWLKRTTEVQPPIRGTGNRYPLDGRAYASYKYFLVEQMDGEEVYVVHHGHKWVKRRVSQEEYTELVKQGKEKEQTVHHTPEGDHYVTYDRKPNPVLIVRPDNTMEFCADHYYQGTRKVLQKLFPYRMTLTSESRRGGLIVRSFLNSPYDHPEVAHPVFKGLRVNVESLQLHSSSEYDYFKSRVDRKTSKKVMASYYETLETAEPFIKVMDVPMLVDLSNEILTDYLEEIKDSKWPYEPNRWRRIEAKHEGDAVNLALIYFWAVQGYMDGQSYRPGSSVMHYLLNNHKDGFISNLKRSLRRKVFSHENQALYYDQIPTGKLPPSNDWGFKIVGVGGNQLEQYS